MASVTTASVPGGQWFGSDGSTHPLEVLRDCELTEEFSVLLSQSFTSRLRIYTDEKIITVNAGKHEYSYQQMKYYKLSDDIEYTQSF